MTMTFAELAERQRVMYQRCLEYLERNNSGHEEQEKLRQKLKVMGWVIDDLEYSAKMHGMIPGTGPDGKLAFPDDLPRYEAAEVLATIDRITKSKAPQVPDSDPVTEPITSPMGQMGLFGSMLRK